MSAPIPSVKSLYLPGVEDNPFASLLVDTFGIFLKPLAEEFSWSREAVSAAFRIAAITVAVCSPPLGYLLDRIHPRRIILPCLTIFGCAFASWSLLTPHL